MSRMEEEAKKEARTALLAKCMEIASPEAAHIQKAAAAAISAVQTSLAGPGGDANFTQTVIALHEALGRMLELGRLEGLR